MDEQSELQVLLAGDSGATRPYTHPTAEDVIEWDGSAYSVTKQYYAWIRGGGGG
jgi:hypothetical protein